MTNSDGPVRLDAKLASIARTGRTAMVCFYVRGQEDDLSLLSRVGDADLILGLVAIREEVAAADTTEQ